MGTTKNQVQLNEELRIQRRKDKGVSVYISYLNREPSISEARDLHDKLVQKGFKVFQDIEGLRGGDLWASKIYSEIRKSDVIIVLLQTGQEEGDGSSTAESEWVQREIDVARGANVSILPLKLYLNSYNIDNINIAKVQQLLAIYDHQFQSYTSPQYARQLREKIQNKVLEINGETLAQKAKEESKTVKQILEEQQRELDFEEESSKNQFMRLVITIDALSAGTRKRQKDWIDSLYIDREGRLPTQHIQENQLFKDVSNEAQFQCDIFMVMPFRKDLDAVYQNHIKEVADKLNLEIKRGDDPFSEHDIIAEIWALINNCRVVIADCTGKNANVFYEMGLANAIGKPVIAITQNEDDIPFDIRQRRFIQYDNTPDGLKILESVLEYAIRGILNE